jgi:hypothetical protein
MSSMRGVARSRASRLIEEILKSRRLGLFDEGLKEVFGDTPLTGSGFENAPSPSKLVANCHYSEVMNGPCNVMVYFNGTLYCQEVSLANLDIILHLICGFGPAFRLLGNKAASGSDRDDIRFPFEAATYYRASHVGVVVEKVAQQ